MSRVSRARQDGISWTPFPASPPSAPFSSPQSCKQRRYFTFVWNVEKRGFPLRCSAGVTLLVLVSSLSFEFWWLRRTHLKRLLLRKLSGWVLLPLNKGHNVGRRASCTEGHGPFFDFWDKRRLSDCPLSTKFFKAWFTFINWAWRVLGPAISCKRHCDQILSTKLLPWNSSQKMTCTCIHYIERSSSLYWTFLHVYLFRPFRGLCDYSIYQIIISTYQTWKSNWSNYARAGAWISFTTFWRSESSFFMIRSPKSKSVSIFKMENQEPGWHGHWQKTFHSGILTADTWAAAVKSFS